MTTGPPSQPPSAPPMAPPPAGAIAYGGFWRRFLGYLIDGVIAGGVTTALLVATKPITCYSLDGTTTNCISTTVSPSLYFIVAIPVIYSIVMWAYGGTIGQRALGMRVVDAATGRNLGLGRSVLRYIGFIISTIVIYIGLIWVAFDARKQGWHDKIAGSLVIRTTR